MTERAEPPLVRGLIDPEEIEDDGSDVEDATELLLQLRTGGELPEDGVPAGVESVGGRANDSGANQHTGSSDDSDAADPA